MGATRKLQGEIDRVLKKVQEGVEVFDGIWNKVYDTESANQKEKFEADLKKEIKKLQRYRDQIKTWIQSSEIKDKKALIDARKLIEREMERFKVCEKETKTKAFSKEGLGQQPKTDPREKAKGETRDWLNNMVSELESQIDSFESEMEGLQVKKGKQRPPRLTHLEESIVRHKAHIIKLEMVLRLLDNDELSPEQVGDIRDLIEDYIMRNQDDFEEFEDVDNLYESLPMEKLEALESMETVPSALPVVGAVVPPVPPLAGAVAAASVKPPLPPPLVASPATLDTSEQLRSLQASVTPSATPAVSSSAATDSAEESSAPSAPDSAEEGGVSLPQPTPPPPKTPPPHSRGSLAGPPPGLGISVPPKAATSRTSSGSPAPPLSGGGGGPARAKEEEASPLGSPLAAARGVGNAAMSEVSSGRALGGLSPVSLGRGLPSQPPNLQLAATVGSSSQPLAEPAGRSVQTRMEGGLGSGPAAAVGSTTVGGGGGAPIGASAVGVPSEELSALHIGGGGGGGGTGSSQLGTYSAIRSFVGKAVEGGSSGGSGEVSSVMGVGLGLGLGTEGGALGAAQQRMFNSVGAQWRPGLPSSAVFQNQTEGTTQFHPRSEISPDQKQRYISRFQQVQQQGVSATVMGASGLGVGQMPPHPSVQPSTAAGQQAQQPALLQPPASVPLPQPAVQQGTSGSQAQPQLSVSATLNQQQQQQPAEETSYQLPTAGEGASVLSQADGRKTPPASAGPLQLPPQQPQDVLSPLSAVPLAEVLAEAESGPAEGAISSAVGTGSSFSRSVGGSVNEEEVKHSGGVDGPVQTETLHAGLQMSVPAAAPSEMSLLPVHHSDFPPPMSQTQVSSLANTLGVIGRKSTLDLGAIGDSLNSAAAGGQLAAGGAAPLGYDHTQSLSLLESSFRNIPHPRDSERPKPHHTQRSPVVAPASYPQTPASIIDNPALWERLDMDVLFFAFYYQQGTYQQYLAARELKKQSWRYHKKYNTWFQRHEEPKMTTDEFEQGTYVYFDFHIVHDDYQTGWCQRIKTEFTFEYSYLEDELAV